MKLFSHNIHGFEGPPKIRAFKALLDLTSPNLLFFQETMCDYEQDIRVFALIRPGWHLCAIFAVDLSCGLLSGWNPYTVCFKEYKTSVGIFMEGSVREFKFSILCINCYGPYCNRDVFLAFGGV